MNEFAFRLKLKIKKKITQHVNTILRLHKYHITKQKPGYVKTEVLTWLEVLMYCGSSFRLIPIEINNIEAMF